MKKVEKKSFCQHGNKNKHSGGDCYCATLEKETKQEAALLTAVVVRLLSASRHLDGEFY